MTYKRVEIEWEDSAFHAGWKARGEYSTSICHTTGYLIHKDRKEVHVAQSWSDCGSVGEVIAIPMKCVRRMEHI